MGGGGMKAKTTIIAAIALIAGCERVTEFKCTAENIEAMKPQLELCIKMAEADYFKRGKCFDKAQLAHCEIIREFHRTEIKAEE
jgi:hypothetical protein